MSTYAESGVDVDTEAKVSRLMYEAAKQTWANRQGTLGEVIVPTDDFSGVRAINVGELPLGTVMNLGFDGVGTKAEIAQRVGDHSTIAHDLIAMVADDAVVRGAEPVIAGSIFDTTSFATSPEDKVEAMRQIAQGYTTAAQAANIAIINGEIAQLGDAVGGYGDFRYNWGASLVWFAHRDRLLDGSKLAAGDKLIAIEEKGFRSNGLSLLRKIMLEKYGEQWHDTDFNDTTFGVAALLPSTIYCKAVVELLGGWDINTTPVANVSGVAHITGGGIPEKLGRMLRGTGLGATLDALFTPSPLMLEAQKLGQVSDDEAYRTWNMGQGMIVATSEPASSPRFRRLRWVQ